jgi:hypothetical protein
MVNKNIEQIRKENETTLIRWKTEQVRKLNTKVIGWQTATNN